MNGLAGPAVDQRLYQPGEIPSQFNRQLLYPLQQVIVLRQPGDAKFQQPRLPGTEDFARSAQFEVALRDVKPVELSRSACRRCLLLAPSGVWYSSTQ